MYDHKKINDINEAHYCSFIKMKGGSKLSSKVKKIYCATLPPCAKVLDQHLQRVNHVAMLWIRAHTAEPARDIHPLNFGWREDANGHYLPLWFNGETLPENIPNYDEEIDIENYSHVNVRDIDYDDQYYKNDYVEFDVVESDSQPWSTDRESDYDCDEEQSHFF